MRYTPASGVTAPCRSRIPESFTEIEMFDAVRDNKRVAQVILALLIIPFAFFGLESYFQDGPGGGDVAVVGGTPISSVEFDQALRERQDRLRNSADGQVDRALLESEMLRRAVLDNLINQRVLALYAADNHMVVTPQQLQETIAEVEAFQENGRFSLQRYESLLRAQGMTPASFEARLAQDVRIQQLAASVGEAGFAAKVSAKRFLAAQIEEREIRELRFPASRFADEVKFADDAVQRYYDSNAARFERPARLKAEYVVLDEAALLKQVKVTDEEVKAYYDGNQARFGQAEERRARHILIQVDADAPEDAVAKARSTIEGIAARLAKEPGQFEAIAKASSQDSGSAPRGGDLGFFPRGMMVQAFDDAAFAQAKGEIGAVVRSDFGFHIIQVTDIKPATIRPFDSVRGEIVEELRKQAAGRRYAEVAEQFSNMVYEQADSLKPVADQLGLEIRSTDWLTRGAEGVGAYASPRLVEALFADDAVKNARNTEAIEAGANTLVSARVLSFEAAQRLPLAEVKGQIEQQLRTEEAARLAAERGAAALAALEKGETVTGEWTATRKLQRGAPGLPAAAMQAVFAASTAKLPAHVGVASPEGGYTVYRIDAVNRPPLTDDDPRIEAVAGQYARLMGERDFAGFLTELRQRYKVETKLAAKAAE